MVCYRPPLVWGSHTSTICHLSSNSLSSGGRLQLPFAPQGLQVKTHRVTRTLCTIIVSCVDEPWVCLSSHSDGSTLVLLLQIALIDSIHSEGTLLKSSLNYTPSTHTYTRLHTHTLSAHTYAHMNVHTLAHTHTFNRLTALWMLQRLGPFCLKENPLLEKIHWMVWTH